MHAMFNARCMPFHLSNLSVYAAKASYRTDSPICIVVVVVVVVVVVLYLCMLVHF